MECVVVDALALYHVNRCAEWNWVVQRELRPRKRSCNPKCPLAPTVLHLLRILSCPDVVDSSKTTTVALRPGSRHRTDGKDRQVPCTQADLLQLHSNRLRDYPL